MTGSEGLHDFVTEHAAVWQAREDAWNKTLAGTDWSKAGEAPASFAAGVLGEAVPTIAEYVALGIPAMVVYGVMHGADAAFRETGSWAAAAAGAIIGGASAGAPAPFLHGAAGKSIIDNAVRGAAGMGVVGGIQSVADPVPRSIATGEWQAPSWDSVSEGVVKGAIGGALMGTFGGLKQQRARVVDSSKPPGEAVSDMPWEKVLGDMSPEDAALHTEAQAIAKLPEAERDAALEKNREVLVVAARDDAGKVYMGKPGQIHSDLLDQLPPGFSDADIPEMGFAGPDGKFMTREEAFDKLHTEGHPAAFVPEYPEIQSGIGLKLDAGDYARASDLHAPPQQVKELAAGYTTAQNVLHYVKNLLGNLLTNESGAGPGFPRAQPEYVYPSQAEPTPHEETVRRQEQARLGTLTEPLPPNTTRAEPPATRAYVYPKPQAPTAAEMEHFAAEKGDLKGPQGKQDIGRNYQQEPKPPMPVDDRATRDQVRDTLRQGGGLGEQLIIHFSKMIDATRSALNPHMPEWLAANEAGAGQMDTVVGHAIRAFDGKSLFFDEAGKRQVVKFATNDPLKPVFDVYGHINEAIHDQITQRVADGKLDPVGYVKDYWAHLWDDPNAALEAWHGSGTGQGRSAGLKERSLPTIEDGLKLGLKLKIPDPGDLMLYDVSSKVKFLQHLDTMDRLEKLGVLVRAVGDRLPFAGAVRIVGRSTERPTADGVEHAYLPAGAAKLYNNTLSQGWYAYPHTAQTFQKLMWLKNTSVATKMIVPLFHSFVIAEQVLATGGQQIMSELHAGNFGRAAVEAVKTGTIIPKAREMAAAGIKGMRDYANMTGDPTVQMLVESGARFGKRQLPYQTGDAGYHTLIAQNKGHVIEAALREVGREARSTIGDSGDNVAGRIAMFVPRVAGVGLTELTRATTMASAPLFDYAIPVMKTGAAILRAQTFLRNKPETLSDAAVQTRMRQIVDNIDDRYGEMNQDNLYWNKWTKQTANMASISTSWAYGTWRWLAASVGYNVERGREWNPEATSSLLGAMVVYAGANAIMTTINTGQPPKDAWDLLNFRTGGVTKTGAPQRGLLPTEFKELYDMGHIVANAFVDPTSIPKGLMNYVAGKENPVVQAFFALVTGEDAVGHKIANTPGGWSGYFLNQVKPIIFNNVAYEPPGTGLNRVERTFIREAPGWLEDPQAYHAAQVKLSDRWTKEELTRAGREATAGGWATPEGYKPPAAKGASKNTDAGRVAAGEAPNYRPPPPRTAGQESFYPQPASYQAPQQQVAPQSYQNTVAPTRSRAAPRGARAPRVTAPRGARAPVIRRGKRVG
jgi:hypothetical protein